MRYYQVEKSGKRVGDKSGSLAALFGVYGCLTFYLSSERNGVER